MIIYIAYPCKVALRGICEGLFWRFPWFFPILVVFFLLFISYLCSDFALFYYYSFCDCFIFILYSLYIITVFKRYSLRDFLFCSISFPPNSPQPPLYLPHRGGQPALRQERKSRAKATPIFSFYCWYRPFRFEPVKVRVVFPLEISTLSPLTVTICPVP